jgi:hypothetical protein
MKMGKVMEHILTMRAPQKTERVLAPRMIKHVTIILMQMLMMKIIMKLIVLQVVQHAGAWMKLERTTTVPLILMMDVPTNNKVLLMIVLLMIVLLMIVLVVIALVVIIQIQVVMELVEN